MSSSTSLTRSTNSSDVGQTLTAATGDRAAAVACPSPTEVPRLHPATSPAGGARQAYRSASADGGGAGTGDAFWGSYVEGRLQHFALPG